MSKKKLFKISAACAGMLVGLGLLAGSAFAGTLKDTGQTSLTPWKVAKEKVEGGTNSSPASTNMGTKLGSITYTPTDIPLGTLSDAVVALTVSAGKLTVKSGVDLQICDTSSNLIAKYDSGSGTNTLIFKKGSGSGVISNNVNYVLKKESGDSNCQNLASDDITLTIPPGTTSTTLTVKTGIAATQQIYDTATGTIVSVLPDFSASVTTKAEAKIAPAEGFKKFTGPATTDIIGITISRASLDDSTTTANGDVTTVKFALSDVTGLSSTPVSATGWTCSLDTSTKIATCTKTANATTLVGTEIQFTFEVDGTTVLAERTFTATVEIDFATSGMRDRTVANNWPLLKDADAGKWVFDAQSVYVPLIKTDPTSGVETYIKLQSTENALLRAQVLASDGSLVDVDLGTITKGVPKTIKGSDLKNAVTAQGKSVDGVNGFAAKLSITTDKANLFGYANIVEPTGVKRVPLGLNSGAEN